MTQHSLKTILWGTLLVTVPILAGCGGIFKSKSCSNTSADAGCRDGSCPPGAGGGGHCHSALCDGSCLAFLHGHAPNLAIPDRQPLGSVNRAHYHTMQTNGEATDFILHRNDFLGKTAELSPAGKDHIMEIAARMRSAPFPVIVERSEHNSDPELDAHRRQIVAQILTHMGNPDAQQRVFVSPNYGQTRNSTEAEVDYYRTIYSRGGFGGGFNNGGFGGGGLGGGFGGGGGGGFGF